MKRLVFVHGRAQEGKEPSRLLLEWTTAWKLGLAKSGLTIPGEVEVAFPYYGDALAAFVKQLSALPPSAIAHGADGLPHPDASFRGELAMELGDNAKITHESIVEALPSGVALEQGPENWAWVQAVLNLLDDAGAGPPFIRAFLADVDAYMSYPAVADSIDLLVSRHFQKEAERTVVVGHSLGSVVAYKILRRQNLPVHSFITVGSPLGVQAIAKRLAPLGWPHGLATWKNAYDDADVVALKPLNGKHFNVGNHIHEYSEVQNTTPNRHGIEGYLSDPTVAKWVYDALV